MTSTLHARRTMWDAAIGAFAALLVFGAVPGVLTAFVGLPLPRHLTAPSIVSWRALFDLMAIVSWCAWAMCAWPILRSVAVRVRSGDPGTAARLSDRVAVRIALGVLAVSAFLGLGVSVAGASTVAGASAVAGASTVAGVSTVVGASMHAVHLQERTVIAAGAGVCNDPKGAVHVVARDDTLARIALARYSDASAWPAIAAANLGRLMVDRTRFVDPGIIAPGWTLELPELDGLVEDRGASRAQAPPTGTSLAGGALLTLGELAAAGVSALVAGLLARRARQLRRLRAFLRDEGARSPVPVEREADLATLVAPFERVPIVDLVEGAARHLARAVAALDPPPGRVQWLRAGRDGVEVRFSDPVPSALDGWRRSRAASWLLPATVDARELSRLDGEPWCPLLLPIGDDERGTWLIPAEVGTCISVIGPRRSDLVRAMRAAAAAWSWNEDVVVVDDTQDAVEALRTNAQRSDHSLAVGPYVLFVGDPATLTGAARRACAVLTTRQLHEAEVTVFVDGRAASAHPLGLTLRPPLLDSSWNAALDALAGRPTTSARVPSRPLVRRTSSPTTVRLTDPPNSEGSGPPQLFGPAEMGGSSGDAGQWRERPETSVKPAIEVQLLTTVPRIAGLQADLPPKRARRAVEVVAYLAMHAPEPVTGERLRMRGLCSTDADAAAKTLFNTVGAARRALGAGLDGTPLLPPASRSGHYRLASAVTVDALRATALLREGLGAADAAERVTRLQEGLQLVKAEPLAGVLAGYAWWRTEGHERRVADAVVDGACALVRAALGTGDVDMARWALAQARKVEPYSEALSRAAMRVAAESGDVRRLHAEWQECQRQVDELDPGGTPSERTEQLYALLRAQLAGGGIEARAIRA